LAFAPIAETCSSFRDGACAFRLHRVETLGAAFRENPDQIDHDARAAHRRIERGWIADIGLHRIDLPDLAERLQVAG